MGIEWPHYLNHLDHLALRLHQISGRNQLIQCVWIYEQAVSIEHLQRFHATFSSSVAGRLIRPSRCPGGRPRWVQGSQRTHPILISEDSLPRHELLEWADAQAKGQIDPIQGSGWILTLQRFDGGTTAISIVCSHVLGDGVGGIMAIHEAIAGRNHCKSYGLYTDRTSLRSALQDGLRAALDLPIACIAACQALPWWLNRRRKTPTSISEPSARQDHDQQEIELPRLICSVESKAWRQQARLRRGSTYALLAAFTVRLAAAYGRIRRKDGAVTLLLPINSRTSLDNDRAIAFDFAKLHCLPDELDSDLSTLGHLIANLPGESSDDTNLSIGKLLPLVPFLSSDLIRSVVDVMFDYSEDLPVTCSNLGAIPSLVADVAGTSASTLFLRGIDSKVLRHELERTKGHLVIVASRMHGRLSLAIEAYELGATNTRARLAETTSEILEGYGMEATIEL